MERKPKSPWAIDEPFAQKVDQERLERGIKESVFADLEQKINELIASKQLQNVRVMLTETESIKVLSTGNYEMRQIKELVDNLLIHVNRLLESKSIAASFEVNVSETTDDIKEMNINYTTL